MEKIVSLCKRRGFIFANSEIYGGIGSTWDYGPLGVELKNNVMRAWWRSVVYDRDDMEGLDAAILMNRLVWRYSGHEATFSDPLVDCRECGKRSRADHLQDGKCPSCGSTNLTDPRNFNLMFKTTVGPVESDENIAYLRPETAQGIFVNFNNVQQAMRRKLPFGIAQIGKAFRNEITPGNFIFRTREFEQMEIEYFVNPSDVVDGLPSDEYWHERWIADCMEFFRRYGLQSENLRLREHEKEELAHYAKRTVDVEYRFPIGWSELMGIANRTDFDLRQHAKASGKSLTYFDEHRKEHVVPYVIEPAAGVDRMLLAFLVEAYREEEVRGEKRVVLRFHPELAPISVAVLPLLKKRDDIVRTAQALRDELARNWTTYYDDTAAIGRLYRRQDEIGTSYCVTVDVQTVGDSDKGESADGRVTIRDRDSMEQVRLPITELAKTVRDLVDGGKAWAEVAGQFGGSTRGGV